MSRTMPSECAHGFVCDWGDFGCDDCTYGPPCADGPHNQPEHCPHGCNGAAPVRRVVAAPSATDRHPA